MDRVAFVIPIHPPDFGRLIEFLDSLPLNSSHVYLVFSSTQHRDEFSGHPSVTPIVIPPGVSFGPRGFDGITDYKKFYALSQLIDSNHEYFITCDASSKIVTKNFTPENVFSKIDTFFALKRIYHAMYWEPHYMTKYAADAFSAEDNEKLKVLTSNYAGVFWWGDLPIYRRDTLKHFFSVAPIPDVLCPRPDYTVYQLYLMLYHDFKPVNVTPLIGITSSLETFTTKKEENIHLLSRVGYTHSWVNQSQYSFNSKCLDALGSFLIFHLNWWIAPDWWVQ